MTTVAGKRPNNRKTALLAALVAVAMLGLGFAAVPLYRLFCQVTGYGGTTRTVASSDGIPVVDRDITVRFDSNVSPDLDWKFYPAQRSVTVKLGEVREIHYFAENNTDRTLHGTAVFNVTPQQMGAFFNKLQCFCFTETAVKPGEKLEMPVVFFVDPEMLDSEEARLVHTLTLSYTFYPSDKDGQPIETSRGETRSNGG